MIVKIKKRSGEIAEFEPGKITLAMQKAFLAVRGEVDEVKLTELTNQVVATLEKTFGNERTPSVEDAQNIVERILMEDGFFDVAKSYIIYRYEHAKERQQKKQVILERIERSDLNVIKRSGRQEKYSSRKLERSLGFAIEGLTQVNAETIIKECEPNLYDGITTEEISRALVMSARSLIERDPEYSKVAARLLFDSVYKEVIGQDTIDYKNFAQQYRQAFIKNIKRGVEIGRLDPALLGYDLEAASQLIKPERDDFFLYLGGQTLSDRYFLSDPNTKQILETPQAFWLRVSMGLALAEDDNRLEHAARFYEIISTLRFVPSTPTLFHAGSAHPQLSSCYLTTINDSLDHIFKCIGDNAQMSKWSGGVANDWTNLRGTGAQIKGTGVESQGVIPFLKVANDTTVAINRSGRRRGATCAYLETWHYDIEDFLELRKNTGDERRRTHDMNTANWIPDLFMKRLVNDEDWTLFSPDETGDLHHLYGKNFEKRYMHYEALARAGKMQLHKVVKAKNLWKKMISMLFETGHPWMTWKDPSNVRSPQDHVGVVHSSNLCTEITLNTSADETAVCNLGSVNLARHIKDGHLDVDLVKDTVTIAMRMLDNVIDINYYPTSEAKVSNLKHRPVGLGVMGFQDALYQLNIPFDSDACVAFADECQEVVSYYAILGSSQLAGERGTYLSYKGSKWDRGILPVDTLDLLEEERGEKILVDRAGKMDWTVVRESIKEHGMRNSNTMAIAPTATIANIAGCVPSIEPIYKNVYVKSNMSGEFIIVNSYLVEDLKKIGLWSQAMLEQIKGSEGSIAEIITIPDELKSKYKEVFEVEPAWLIKAAAYRGKWIDQSQSLNLFVKGNSGKKISDMYQYAWAMGLKTTYYLRTLAATAIEQSTLELSKQQSVSSTIKHDISGSQAPATPAPIAAPVLEPILSDTRPQPVVGDQLAAATTESGTGGQVLLSLCRLDDPTCESCQ